MENGWKIRVAEVEHDAVSVDVPRGRRTRRKAPAKILKQNKTARFVVGAVIKHRRNCNFMAV